MNQIELIRNFLTIKRDILNGCSLEFTKKSIKVYKSTDNNLFTGDNEPIYEISFTISYLDLISKMFYGFVIGLRSHELQLLGYEDNYLGTRYVSVVRGNKIEEMKSFRLKGY